MQTKKKKKKYNRNKEPNYIKFKNQIKNNSNDIWIPYTSSRNNLIKNNSWFDINENKYNSNKNVCTDLNFSEKIIPKEFYKCIKVELQLTLEQQIIMQRWMKAYIHMYNETLHFMKNQPKDKFCTSFKTIRTYHLKSVRDKLIKESQCANIIRNTCIYTHIMDAAIKLACANYKSAITNFKRGNIKNFRIRYWRFNKNYNIIDIEKEYFSQNTIGPKIFGLIKAKYNNSDFNLNLIPTKYNCSCKILYEKYTNKYILLVPEIVEKQNVNQTHKLISLDPGIRTFLTGLSENETIEICNNPINKIKPIIKNIDKINKLNKLKQITNKKYKRITKRNYKKIKDLVDELHWKTINYLTNKYKIILIGDMSIKEIIKKETSVLSNMTKRIGSSLSFFKFKQRLKQKCYLKDCKYEEVNEMWTSKLCSCCGNYYNESLGSNKIFKCPKCKTIINRDINGCRGIYLKMTK